MALDARTVRREGHPLLVLMACCDQAGSPASSTLPAVQTKQSIEMTGAITGPQVHRRERQGRGWGHRASFVNLNAKITSHLTLGATFTA
jgi:hypothetical protein